MKLIATLFVCIVACECSLLTTNWVNRVVPDGSYYCYNLPIKMEWYSAKYYRKQLIDFPIRNQLTCSPEITNMDEFITAYEDKLKVKRDEIQDELETHLKPFTDKIDEIHQQYMDNYKETLNKELEADSEEFQTKLQEYSESLTEKKEKAVKDFNREVMNTIGRINAFHDRLMGNFKRCLEARNERIAEYNSLVNERATKYKARYEECLKQGVEKRVEFVRCMLEEVVGEVSEETMEEYRQCLLEQIASSTAEFNSKVDEAVVKIKQSYRCNYTCYFKTGCYNFNRFKYSKTIVKLPALRRYNYVYVKIPQFNVDWNGVEYKKLQTCDPESDMFDEQKYRDDLEVQATEYRSKLEENVAEWQQQVEEWKVQATSELEERVKDSVPTEYDGVELTEDEKDSIMNNLREQANTWVDCQVKIMSMRVKKLNMRLEIGIRVWLKRANRYVSMVKKRYEDCLIMKAKKVSSYKECLQERINSYRKHLEDKLAKCVEVQMKYFNSFYECSFRDIPNSDKFSSLIEAYKNKIDARVLEVMQKFDGYWIKWQPQLEEHFECGVKCMHKIVAPCYNGKYKWNLMAPCTSDLVFQY